MTYPVAGVGLGLRRALLAPLRDVAPERLDFLEVAPENWLEVGGKLQRAFAEYNERYPIVFHGLSLSLGAPAPLDTHLVRKIATFMQEHGIRYYSEHLSYCGDDAHLYDLLPIPFTQEAAHYVADRIRQTQDIIGERIAVENISYYASVGQEMTEAEFINEVLERADCDLLLDVNNVIVNSINHRYDPRAFLAAMPSHRVRYIHVAGHDVEAPDLRIDTHGSAVSDAVWDLLDRAYERFGPVPTLLERDFNIPPLDELLGEVDRVRYAQRAVAAPLADRANG
ncbi:MAG: DUF692 domain-containing protein [Pseudomonadota bacterium]